MLPTPCELRNKYFPSQASDETAAPLTPLCHLGYTLVSVPHSNSAGHAQTPDPQNMRENTCVVSSF